MLSLAYQLGNILGGEMFLLRRFNTLSMRYYIGRVQKSRFLHADINKRRLHSRQYSCYFPLIYIANQIKLGRSLNMNLLQNTLLNQGNTGFHMSNIN